MKCTVSQAAHLEHDGQGDADGAAAVSHAILEGVDVARLVLAGQAGLVADAVLRDVLNVRLGQLLNGLLDGLIGQQKAARSSDVSLVLGCALGLWCWASHAQAQTAISSFQFTGTSSSDASRQTSS